MHTMKTVTPFLFFFLSFNFIFPSPSHSTLKNLYSIENADTVPSLNAIKYFVSSTGSDSNDGRSALTPKLKISSVESLTSGSMIGDGTSLNLEANSLFREQYDPVRGNGSVTSFSLTNSRRFAKITGMDVIADWNATSALVVYQHQLKHSIDIGSPGYTFIIIAEIDTTLEKTHPLSAVKYLTYVPDINMCSRIPGSYYTDRITTNPLMVYMHPSEGVPGKSKYRYEVSTRNNNINGYFIDNGTYEKLILQTAAYGYGMLSAGKNSVIKNIIFQGGGIHHTVVKSGLIDSCLFLPGPKGLSDRIAAVFYSAEGKDADNKITNTVFLDVPNAVYTHTNGEINHKSLILDNVYAFADTADASIGLSVGDTDSAAVLNSYVEGYPSGWYGGSTQLNIKNSIFRNTNQSALMLYTKNNIVGEAKINNSLIVTNGNDNNQRTTDGRVVYGVRALYNNLRVDVSNTIFHGVSTWHTLYQTVTTFDVAGSLKANYNIYICDVNDDNSMHMCYANNSGGMGTSTNVSSNYNAYILLRGSKFHWTVFPNNNNETNVSTLSEWQSLTGQDKNSILIDLRNNPAGLKAIFVDPLNGNWTLTQTPQADSIRNISAGMTRPPLFYPKRPLILDYDTPFKAPGGYSSFRGTMNSESESLIQWQTFNESEVSSFVIEFSLDGIHFLEAGSLKALNNNKNNNYQYVHTHPDTDTIFYRLKSFYIDSTNSYSSAIKLVGNFSQEFKITIYPNPFERTVTVLHPRRDKGQIFIYDYSGRLIKICRVEARSSRTLLYLPDFPAGRYFFQWTNNREKLSGTVVK